MDWLRAEIARFACTLGFFSRLPVPGMFFAGEAETMALNRAVVWFPVAGLVIAIPPAGVYWFASVFLPYSVAAGLALGALLLVTGALHEDGFADCADGLGGGKNRDQKLEIMRDSAIGTYGTVALILSIGLRWAALSALPPSSAIAALFVAHSAARGSIATALAFSRYARKKGVGSMVSGGISTTLWIVVMVLSLLIAVLFGGTAGLLAAAAGITAAGLFLWWFHRGMGGYTGDALGSMEQIAEITILVILASFAGALR